MGVMKGAENWDGCIGQVFPESGKWLKPESEVSGAGGTVPAAGKTGREYAGMTVGKDTAE